MTYIPFKQEGNRLYIDLQLYKEHFELREFINKLNAGMRPMPFNIDYTARKVWFYPPENYVMPALPKKIAGPLS